MGVDFACILDVALSPRDVLELPSEVLDLPQRLDRFNDELARIWAGVDIPVTRQTWKADLWPATVALDRLDEAESEEPLEVALTGPNWFNARIFQRSVGFSHVSRWKFFLNDVSGLHRPLLASCRLFAGVLGARRLLYLPDLGMEKLCEDGVQDRPFEELVGHLQKAWGPPSLWRPPYPLGERYWEVYFVEEVGGPGPPPHG